MNFFFKTIFFSSSIIDCCAVCCLLSRLVKGTEAMPSVYSPVRIRTE